MVGYVDVYKRQAIYDGTSSRTDGIWSELHEDSRGIRFFSSHISDYFLSLIHISAATFFSNPGNPDYVYLDYVYFARLLEADKQYDEAVAQFDKAVAGK